ncbi:hypothetical protein SDC9_149719 [bioreactor metagenome]|uniref:Uncharacterized protein n=1 Tax=bioreactor metagenome TaxID=1076179 RepID=A0A645EPP2_9ZZZZ
MLDEQDADVVGQFGDDLEQLAALARRDAGCGFVQQQDAGSGRQRQRDFEQALFAIGQLRHRGIGQRVEAQPCEQGVGFVKRCRAAAQRSPPGGTQAVALADGQHYRQQGGQAGKQGIDLEGAHQSDPRPLVAGQCGNVLVAQLDASACRAVGAGQQVDQRGFTRTIGADQGLSCAGLQRQVDAVDRAEGTETDAEVVGTERCCCHHALLIRTRRDSAPMMPPRPTMTTTMRKMPSQNIQYCGFRSANQSWTSI